VRLRDRLAGESGKTPKAGDKDRSGTLRLLKAEPAGTRHS